MLRALLIVLAGQQLTAVRFGKLWDGDKVIDRAVVVVQNGRIRSVQTADAPVPPGAAGVGAAMPGRLADLIAVEAIRRRIFNW